MTLHDKDREWWKKAVVYQIYPRSFSDSNGDGIGDIPGIISRLDYIASLGVDVIWLSPVYASPNEDNGYDISDYTAIHPDYGTMDDFDTLVSQAKKRGLEIIMDLVINHTSTAHRWFQLSRKKVEPYTDVYYWSDSIDGTPNNWTGFFGGGTWEYDEERKASYLHLFAPHQADLNYHNPLVWEEIEKILRFWLDKGIAGFRCDVINIIYKDSLQNGKKKMILTGSEHYLTLDGTHEILHKLNGVLRPYNAFTVGETVFVDTEDANLLTSPEREELSMVFSFQHMEVDQFVVKWFRRKFSWIRFISVLDKWQREVGWNTIYFENHDQIRSVSRFGSLKYREASAKLLALLLLTLRGTPFVYQGEEIGMTNFDFQGMEEVMDVESRNIWSLLSSFHVPKSIKWRIIRGGSRDHARTPMQWNGKEGAGFSSGVPWLGINSNNKEINVETEDGDPYGILNFYRKLISFRKESRDLLEGDYLLLENSRNVARFRRGGLEIVLNHSDKEIKSDSRGKTLISTYNEEKKGFLRPWEARILKTEENNV
ncbi:MAG: alpha-glucosidase [Candidatus Ornithospirochaeta sp.]